MKALRRALSLPRLGRPDTVVSDSGTAAKKAAKRGAHAANSHVKSEKGVHGVEYVQSCAVSGSRFFGFLHASAPGISGGRS